MKFSKAKVFVGLTCAVFLGFVIIFAIGRFILSSMMLSVRVSWADDQIEIIELSRRKAFEGDAHDAVRSLYTVVHYYPSGTKQPKGSKLDRIVETYRQKAISDIIQVLRKKTGKDLGSDPEAWLEHVDKEFDGS